MSRIALDLGFIQIYWYSVFIFIGLFFGIFYIFRECRRLDVDEDMMINLVFYTLIFGIIGARLYYVIFNLDYYLAHISEIFEIWNGGLAIHGGMIAGLITVVIYTRRREIEMFKLIDILIPALLIGQIFGRWGNFFNQEAYGPIVSGSSLSFLPNFIKEGMHIAGSYRAPLFLYESLLNFFFLIAILIIRKKPLIKNGYITSFYMIFYGFIRFILEFFRVDSLYIGKIRVAQVASLAMIVIGIYLFIRQSKGRRLENLYNGDDVKLA